MSLTVVPPDHRAKVQTTAQRVGIVWPSGMLIHDSDLDELYVGDGETAGGIASSSGSSVAVDYNAGALAAKASSGAMLISIDETAATGGSVQAIEVLATAEGALDELSALAVGATIDPIVQKSGTFADASYGYSESTNTQTAWVHGGAGAITTFVADTDNIQIGNTAQFSEIEVIVGTGASDGGVAPTFEHSVGYSWAAFTPTDGTAGFQRSGVISFDVSALPTWTKAGATFKIRITRSAATVATVPVIDEVQVAATVVYSWDKAGAVDVASITATAAVIPRYMWVAPGYGGTYAYGGAVDVITTTGGTGYVSFRLPPSMTTLVSADWNVRAGTTTNATADVDQESSYGDPATNEPSQNTIETDNATTYNLVKDVLTLVSAMSVLTGVTGGDLVSIEFKNNETTGSIFNFGFSIEWT